MVDGFSLVCPACGRAADLSAGLAPNADGQLICAGCGAEIPIPLAAPDDSQGDTTTASPADLATVVDPRHQVHPAGADTIESVLGDCGSGRYDERETIGKGGMGEIVLCVEQNTRREVAMKRMLPTAAGHAKQRARFVEEAQVTAQLEHPNIVPVHELGRDEHGAIYFTMKLVKGRSLAELLTAARDGEVTHSLGELLQMFLKVCDGVAFAHSRGVVHRDLKPANIMVGDFGEVLVMDWGIARILGRDEPDEDSAEQIVQSSRQDTDTPLLHTMAGSIIGSPQYMPPEQAAGQIDKIDHRSDIYALGAILYNILTLKPPFEGGDARAIVDKVVKGSIAPPERRAPDRDIPRELSAVAIKCLARFRGKRYQSVPDLQRDISLYLEGRSVSAAPDTFAQAFVKLVKRNKPVSVAVAAAAVILIAVVSVAFVRVTGAMRRAVAAQQEQRATALAASEQLAGQAVRAAEQGRFAEADVRADTAAKIMPDGPWGPYAMGVVAFEKKDFTTARKHLDQSLRMDASHAPSKIFLSRVLTVVGDVKKAEDLVAGADAIDDWRSLDAAGDTLVSVRRYVRAVKAYEKVAELMVSDATTPPMLHSETKDKLSRAKMCLAFEGFRASILPLPAAEQAQRLEAKLKIIYGSDASVKIAIEKGTIAGIRLRGKGVRRLDPFRGMYLMSFACQHTSVVDLNPLRGMPLTNLDCAYSGVHDLTPLKGMPLTKLAVQSTMVVDLTPLKDMPLAYLDINGTKVTDLTLLKGMPLEHLNCNNTAIRDLSPLKGMRLTWLDCGRTRVSDLTPLKGMPLQHLGLPDTRISDLTPLKGIPLTFLSLYGCSSLTSLRGIEGMPLTGLEVHLTKVTDLTPLKGMHLEKLRLTGTKVTDLGPLKGMGLKELSLNEMGVTDLTPLEGMPLKTLSITETNVTDLTPLADMKLESFRFQPRKITKGIEIVRGMKSIRKIGLGAKPPMDPEEFWKRYDAGKK